MTQIFPYAIVSWQRNGPYCHEQVCSAEALSSVPISLYFRTGGGVAAALREVMTPPPFRVVGPPSSARNRGEYLYWANRLY